MLEALLKGKPEKPKAAGDMNFFPPHDPVGPSLGIEVLMHQISIHFSHYFLVQETNNGLVFISAPSCFNCGMHVMAEGTHIYFVHDLDFD